MQEQLIPLKEIPKIWKIPLWTLYKYSSQGKIPTVKIGTRVYVDVRDLQNWLTQHKRGVK